MPRTVLLTCIALMFLASCGLTDPAYGESPGKAGVLIVGEDTPRHRLAAREFASLAARMLGKEFPLVQDADGLDTVILIGSPVGDKVPGLVDVQLPDIKQMLPEDTGVLMSPEQDSFVVVSVPARATQILLLAGLKDTGTLYAVYDYFERFCNVGYFADGDRVPHKEALPVENIRVVEVPRFGFREMHSYVGPNGAGYGFMPARTHFWNKDQIERFISWYAKNRINVLLLELGPATSGVLEKENPSPLGGDPELWPFKTRWDYWHHVVRYARQRGMKIMYQSELGGTRQQWKEVLDEYGTDHLYFSGFGEAKGPVACKRLNGRIGIFRELDPQAIFYIYGWSFAYLDWTPQEYEEFCRDAPENMVLIDLCGCDWGAGVEKAQGFFGRPWGTGIIHSFTQYGDLLHSRVTIYLERLQKWTVSPWGNQLVAFVMGPEANIAMADYWMGYCYGKLAWNPGDLTVEKLANDFSRLRFGKSAHKDMADSVLQLEEFNCRQRPAPNIGSEGRGVMPIHRSILAWNPHPLFTTEQHYADHKLKEDLTPFFESIRAALNVWPGLKDDPFYQNQLFQLARTCLGEIATRDLIATWRHYQRASKSIAEEDQDSAARHVEAFNLRRQHLQQVFDCLEYLLSKHPDYSYAKFLEIALVPGVYREARKLLVRRSFYDFAGYMRNGNYEAFHYVYRKETDSFLEILSMRLDAKLPELINLGTHEDLQELDDLRLAGNLSAMGDLRQDADIVAVFARLKMENINRENWSLPSTPGTKRDAVERACAFLLGQQKTLARLPEVPPILQDVGKDR